MSKLSCYVCDTVVAISVGTITNYFSISDHLANLQVSVLLALCFDFKYFQISQNSFQMCRDSYRSNRHEQSSCFYWHGPMCGEEGISKILVGVSIIVYKLQYLNRDFISRYNRSRGHCIAWPPSRKEMHRSVSRAAGQLAPYLCRIS